MKISLLPKGDSIKHPENKPCKGHPKATWRQPKGQPNANWRLLKGHLNATQRLPKGHLKATKRLSRGHPKATKKKVGKRPPFFSFFQSSFKNSYHDDICAIILQYRYYQIHKYNRFLVRMICLSHLFINYQLFSKSNWGNSCSFWNNLVSFRTFRCPYSPTTFLGWELKENLEFYHLEAGT